MRAMYISFCTIFSTRKNLFCLNIHIFSFSLFFYKKIWLVIKKLPFCSYITISQYLNMLNYISIYYNICICLIFIWFLVEKNKSKKHNNQNQSSKFLMIIIMNYWTFSIYLIKNSLFDKKEKYNVAKCAYKAYEIFKIKIINFSCEKFWNCHVIFARGLKYLSNIIR
jgi:hypothetical protein